MFRINFSIKQFSILIFLAYRKKYWSNSFKFLILPVIDKLRRRIELICASFCTRIQFGGEKLERKRFPLDISFSTSISGESTLSTLLDEIAFVDEETTANSFSHRTRRRRFFFLLFLEQTTTFDYTNSRILTQAARAEGKRPLPGRVVYQRGRIMHLTHDPACLLVRIISPLWTIDRR